MQVRKRIAAADALFSPSPCVKGIRILHVDKWDSEETEFISGGFALPLNSP